MAAVSPLGSVSATNCSQRQRHSSNFFFTSAFALFLVQRQRHHETSPVCLAAPPTMSANSKNGNRYWCKFCAVFVRDTKLERTNHEATARHQGNIKRSLRDLHRNHEQAERDKERAKREVERLNGVVPGSSTSTSTHGGAAPVPEAPQQATAADRQKQREQLAAMGIEMPSEVRPEMAMAGQWTVTSTKVIEAPKEGEDDEEQKIEARASGVRKREVTEEEQAVEEAIQGLFKKPKRWGRDTKTIPADEDAELDALLSGGPLVKKEAATKEEEADDTRIKKEEDIAGDSSVKPEEPVGTIKQEPGEAGLGGLDTDTGAGSEAEAPAVVFKKRKPKGLRTK